ncbi:MAG: hypothetical protein QOH30_2955, partial [Baekduia sp.]|nr:hypothetical protein [Baekduia sp.]
MRAASVLAGLVLSALLLIAAPTAGLAREPPNQNDPCSAVGRDTCNTTGVGFYQRYRYGLRWFGDYRGAVPGEAHTFCIDLRFWYPSPDYRFRETTGGALKNRDGRAVALQSQQKMAYAVWSYGRSANADQQAAVMLYVHGLMGDGEPGEVDPSALNPRVAALHERIDRDASRFHGPYRIETKLSTGLTVGKPASATIRVLSAEGHALPNLRLTLAGRGAGGLPAQVRTGTAGVAQVPLVPTDATGVRVGVTTEALPSTMPRIFTPTVPAAARNGQRLVAPGSQRVSFQVSAPVSQGQITVSSAATPAVLLAGEVASDRVTIGGVSSGWRATVTLRTYGPFRSADAIRCDQPPAAETSFAAAGPGTITTPPTRMDGPGWYTYVLVVPGDADHLGATTPCAEPTETFRVEVQPRVTTAVS